MPICKLQQIWYCDTVVDSLAGDILRHDTRVLVVLLCLLSSHINMLETGILSREVQECKDSLSKKTW